MFLHELKKNKQKILFIQLTTLIMMAEGSKETTAKALKKSDDSSNITDIFWENIDDKEMEILRQYIGEIGGVEQLQTTSKGFMGVNTNTNTNVPGFLIGSVRGTETQNSIPKILKSILHDELKNQSKTITKKYGNDENFKKDFVQKLVDNGEDILNITPKLIRKMMLTNPVIQQEVLESTADALITATDNSLFAMREKKIVLFELIGAGFSSGAFEVQEKQLVTKICKLLDVDNEYIEEFTDVASRLFDVNKEINDLINE